jgi:DNA-binding response OmpR family regulator
LARILLCEDDEFLLELVSHYLSSAEHIVETSTNGKEALQKLQESNYDLAILDWGLPEMTGIEVCRNYRANGGSIPILMLTGMEKSSNREEGMQAGANDYLCKPFKGNELNGRVKALLEPIA